MTAARPALERSALPACCHSLTCTHTHRPRAHTHPSHIHTAHTPQTHRPTHTPLPRDALYLTYVATSPAHTDPLEPAGARGRRVHAPCSSTPQPQTHRQGGGRLRRHLPENLLPTEPETSPPPPVNSAPSAGSQADSSGGSSVALFGLPSCPPPQGAEGSGDVRLNPDSGPEGRTGVWKA